jgi:hypothetical protein
VTENSKVSSFPPSANFHKNPCTPLGVAGSQAIAGKHLIDVTQNRLRLVERKVVMRKCRNLAKRMAREI